MNKETYHVLRWAKYFNDINSLHINFYALYYFSGNLNSEVYLTVKQVEIKKSFCKKIVVLRTRA